jgi:biotin/methionine sulfoxide reductase
MTRKRFPGLEHWGAYTALVEDGRVVGCEPFAHDPAPSPMLDAIPAMVHSPLRISRPAIREGWREGRPRTGHDRFHEVSWDEAIATVAEELQRVRHTHGADSILGGSYGWASAGRVHHARMLVRRFLFLGGGCVDQLGNYSFGAAQFFLPHVIGTFEPVTGRVTDWPSIIKHTRLFVAFGGLALKNGEVTYGGGGAHVMKQWLRRARDAGVAFVVVTPNRGDVPDFLQAQWVPIRPNTDTAMMLGMAHTLLSEQRHDAGFLARYCTGFEAFSRYLLGADDGVAKDAQWAEAICGVPADTIRDLARRAAAVRSLITCAWSLQRAHRGEQPYWAAITLAAMLGGIGLPGGGFAFGHGSGNGVGAPRADVPGPETVAPLNPARRGIPVARIADMLCAPNTEYEFNGHRAKYPDIHLVYWAGGNPFHHHQDLNRLQRAWQKPDTIIVHDCWWTPTARRADIVLPATTSLERNDVGGSTRDNFLLAMHQAIAPVGQARNDFDIFRELAGRLGYEAAFTEGRDEMAWCQFVYDRVRTGAARKGVDLPGFQQFWAEGFVELPPPARRDFVLFEDFRADPDNHRLKTPSGKIEIVSDEIAKLGYQDFPPHPAWLPPAEWLGSAEAQQDFPLHLITNQPSVRLHSQMDPGPVSAAAKIAGREPIRISTADAARRQIRNGDAVRVFNARGACLAGAIVDDGIMPSVAVMATGAWIDQSDGEPERHGNPNVLTLDVGTSRLTQGSSAQTALVEIERWTGPLPPVRSLTPPEIVEADAAAAK